MSLQFTKMQACGNDFIVIDDRQGRFQSVQSALAVSVCQRRLGIGADGLLLVLEGSGPGRFGMSFINSDGLIGEMCGNGARCLAAYLHRCGHVEEALVIETLVGPVRVDLRSLPSIELILGPARILRQAIDIDWAGHTFRFDEVDAGPPHVVCWVDSIEALDQVDMVGLGRMVRHHPAFAPRGCNVNLAALAADGSVHLRTYERGVEDETLGCGTGAVSATAVLLGRLPGAATRRVVTRSGEALMVDLSSPEAPSLRGGAQFVAQGTIDPSLWGDLLSLSKASTAA
jgi:diaminopimelate epimerase